jgi:hypothetical protein
MGAAQFLYWLITSIPMEIREFLILPAMITVIGFFYYLASEIEE